MRRIHADVVQAIDEAGAVHPAFARAINEKRWRTLIANVSRAFIGIKEDTNKNDGYWIELIQKTVDGRAMREPYCMAFVQTMIAYVELKTGIKSPLIATESVMQLWNAAPEAMKSKQPRPGMIAIWNHRGTTRGHTGIVWEVQGATFTCIEGNTPPGTKEFARGSVEGEGIYLKLRTLKSVGTMDLLGFVSPFPE